VARPIPIPTRLAAHTDVNGPVHPSLGTACHVWTGCRDDFGYGRVAVRRVPRPAHRIAWEQAHGPVPAGLYVLHRCDNPACLRLEHLFLGTAAENSADMVAKGRTPLRRRRLAAAERAALLAAYAAGEETLSALGARFGLKLTSVCRIARDAGVTRGGQRAGERHGSAKLADAQVAAIASRLRAGERRSALAREYGVTVPTIRRIASGEHRSLARATGLAPVAPSNDAAPAAEVG
jgi:hypothetical protein